MITTVAGTGGEGFSGDGGPATAALLQTPSDVAVDSTGNLYIADTANHRIRKVNAAGVITTTTGFFVAPQAVAVDAAGNVFVGDSIYLKQISADGTISTLLTSSVAIQCLTVDSQGDVLFGESDSSVGSHPRVRKRAPDGTVTTIAGTGATGYSGDGGPATAAMLFFSGRVDIGP